MALTVTVDLPADVEQRLLLTTPDLAGAAKEALLISLYRQGKLTHVGLSQALGLDRFQTEAVLHVHNVIEDLGTAEDYLEDARRLGALLQRHR